MKMSSPQEAVSTTATQLFPNSFWNPAVQNLVHKNIPMALNIIECYFYKIYFNVIILFMLSSPK
jgi:hypothetical protein